MPEYNNIEEFDKEQEEKFKKEQEQKEQQEQQEQQEEQEEQNENIDVNENEQDENIYTEDEEQDEEENTEEENTEEQPKKEDKKEYAFSKLRKEKDEYKRKLDEMAAFQKKWDEIANKLGYIDSKELLEAEMQKEIEEEAKKKGVDPEFYTRFKNMEDKLTKVEKEKQEVEKQSKLLKFTNSLNDLSKQYNLTENDKENILNEMENDGYSIDDLYGIKNPKRFILGYMQDKIEEQLAQKKLNKNKEKFKEEKFTNTSSNKKSLKDLQREEIMKDMKRYAKENGFNFED